MKTLARLLTGGLFAATLIIPAGGAFAQTEKWPAKPIRMIMPLAAGGTSDVASRVIAAHLGEALGQPVVVENRPGANGVLGVRLAAMAAPDGYTVVVGSSTTMAANSFLYKNPGTQPLKDFVPIAMLGTLDFVLAVPAGSPYKTVQEMVAAAKAQPGRLSYAYGSSGSLLCAEAFRHAAGIDMLKVPYQSTPQAITDLVAGRIDLVCDALGTTMPLVKVGKLRFIGATGKTRDSMLPDVPTLLESNVPATHQTWAGFFAPAQTPPEIVRRMSTEIVRILALPEVQSKVREQGFLPAQIGSTEFRAIHEAEFARTETLVREAGISPE